MLFFSTPNPTPNATIQGNQALSQDSQSPWTILQITPQLGHLLPSWSSQKDVLAVPKPWGFGCLKKHSTLAIAFLELLNGDLTLTLKDRADKLQFQSSGPRSHLEAFSEKRDR